jgi:putative methionine-R-sulfoxide reductase with GAF domain
MPPTIPGTNTPHWWERELPTTLVVAAPPVLAAGAATLKAFGEGSSLALKVLLGGGALWLLLGSVVKTLQAFHKDKAAKKAKSPIDLLGCIHPVYEVLLALRRSQGKDGTGKLRLTIHRVDHATSQIEQCVDYIGETDSTRVAGRRFQVSQGIVGRAARMGEVIVVERTVKTDDEYIADMMKEWSYTRSEAERLDRSRWSFMAVPILGDDSQQSRAIGVLYADSTDPQFFSEGIGPFVLAATAGVAKFIRLRYP